MRVYLSPFPKSNWWTDLLHFLHIPHERKERVKVHYYDHWDAAATIAVIAAPVLKQLKERGISYTDQIDMEDLPEPLREANTASLSAEELPLARWHWLLDEIIWALENYVDDEAEDQFYSGNPGTFNFVPVEDRPEVSKLEIIDDPEDPFVIDREGLTAFYDRVRNGLRLFGKYYMNLWD